MADQRRRPVSGCRAVGVWGHDVMFLQLVGMAAVARVRI